MMPAPGQGAPPMQTAPMPGAALPVQQGTPPLTPAAAQPVLAAAAPAGAPVQWMGPYFDATYGRYYYYDPISRQSQWAATEAAPPAASPLGAAAPLQYPGMAAYPAAALYPA